MMRLRHFVDKASTVDTLTYIWWDGTNETIIIWYINLRKGNNGNGEGAISNLL